MTRHKRREARKSRATMRAAAPLAVSLHPCSRVSAPSRHAPLRAAGLQFLSREATALSRAALA